MTADRHMAELEAILTDITEATGRIEAGQTVNLSVLDDRVAKLCDELIGGGARNARRVGARLPEAIAALEALSKILAERTGTSSGSTDSPSKRARAIGAYGGGGGRAR